MLLPPLLLAHSAPFSSFTQNSPVIAQLQVAPNIQSRRRGAAVFPGRADTGLLCNHSCNAWQGNFVLASALCWCRRCVCQLRHRR